ncbi:MAG: bifunctional glutamate N-acetyltransferase/amino-acid acetyltransferase ArgJ [Chloroflexi bacterium]|nr:bifunctional glutamate N-acetyltransferase/amino-acid acetyltransferase ArgJ [Chloroflexota bacterium]
MKARIDFIASGGVTSPAGFYAGATYAGIKKKAVTGLDLAILYSEMPCAAAALFTTNKIKAAPVLLSQEHLKTERAAAVIVNSGCANACTGAQGLADARETASIVATNIGINTEDVVVASTGVIGQPLPMGLMKAGIGRIVLSREAGHDFAKAIMTTDTVPKETAVTVRDGGVSFSIGGVAKGAGMIHPNLATMLAFVTTDAVVEPDFLKTALREAADISFDMLSIDGDTSTNDTLLLMANGKAGNAPVSAGGDLASAFQQALNEVCIYLAKAIARDGEGATKLIEVTVSGAASLADARLAARTVVSSPLVKTAVHGGDPNWGRVIAAVGRSGAAIEEAKTDLYIGNICLFKAGRPLNDNQEKAAAALKKSEIPIEVRLNLDEGTATAWGCDLSAEYVAINSEYMT